MPRLRLRGGNIGRRTRNAQLVHDRRSNRSNEERMRDNVTSRDQVARSRANENSEQRLQRRNANALRQREARQRAIERERRHRRLQTDRASFIRLNSHTRRPSKTVRGVTFEFVSISMLIDDSSVCKFEDPEQIVSDDLTGIKDDIKIECGASLENVSDDFIVTEIKNEIKVECDPTPENFSEDLILSEIKDDIKIGYNSPSTENISHDSILSKIEKDIKIVNTDNLSILPKDLCGFVDNIKEEICDFDCEN